MRVADYPEGRAAGAALAWDEAWFCAWARVPNLLDEVGPFDLVVEECSIPVPTKVRWDDPVGRRRVLHAHARHR